jgi:hypothetical protein
VGIEWECVENVFIERCNPHARIISGAFKVFNTWMYASASKEATISSRGMPNWRSNIHYPTLMKDMRLYALETVQLFFRFSFPLINAYPE